MDSGGNRRHTRFLVDDCSVEVRAAGLTSVLGKGDVLPVVDLSLGGMQFISLIPIQLGQRVRLSLQVADLAGFIKTTGDVCWQQHIPGEAAYRTGVEFPKLDDDSVAKLKRLEQSYVPRQREILATTIYQLQIPESVAKKLVGLIVDGLKSRPQLARHLHVSDEAASDDDVWSDVERKRRRAGDDDQPAHKPDEEGGDQAAPAQADQKGGPPPLDGPGAEDESTAAGASEPTAGEPEAATALEADEDESQLEGETSEPQTKAQGQAHELELIPMYLLGGKHRIRMSRDRKFTDEPVDRLVLPGLGAGHVACRLTDSSMTADEGMSFRVGDVVVFARDRLELLDEGSLVFVAAKGLRCFRQVCNVKRSKLILKALNPEYPDIDLLARQVKAIWPCVAHVRMI